VQDESEFEELKSTAVQEIAESLLPEIEDANPEVKNDYFALKRRTSPFVRKEINCSKFRWMCCDQLACYPRLQVQNQQLEKLLTATMTPSHQHYAAVAAQLKVLQSNSYWPHEKKLVFARRLLRQLA